MTRHLHEMKTVQTRNPRAAEYVGRSLFLPLDVSEGVGKKRKRFRAFFPIFLLRRASWTKLIDAKRKIVLCSIRNR